MLLLILVFRTVTEMLIQLGHQLTFIPFMRHFCKIVDAYFLLFGFLSFVGTFFLPGLAERCDRGVVAVTSSGMPPPFAMASQTTLLPVTRINATDSNNVTSTTHGATLDELRPEWRRPVA